MSSQAKAESRALVPDLLIEQLLHEYPLPTRYWVAFSGGLDSTVLLHLFARCRSRLPAPLAAVHVDHGLHDDSAAWCEHCRQVCRALDIPFESLQVDALGGPGDSPEAAARVARYAAIAEIMGTGAMLLTAHHLDDQAETLVLQLLRAAGVEGLSAMPRLRLWGKGWHARPLLGIQRSAIHAWAVREGLAWVDDPSNAQIHADRNFLRHHVMPQLLQRWPRAHEAIASSASHCADAAYAVHERTARDLHEVATAGGERLCVSALQSLEPSRRHLVLREWLKRLGAPRLSGRRLDDAVHQLLDASADRELRIAWDGVELRRFRGEAWLLRTVPTATPVWCDWLDDGPILGPGLGRIRRVSRPGGIDVDRWANSRVQVGYRRDDFRCQPAGRSGSRSFKKVAQDFAIPPWQREIHPIIYLDGMPAAIANCCICEPFAASEGTEGWWIEWTPDAVLSPTE